MKKFREGFRMYLIPTEHIQQQLLWYGYYEKELGETLKKVIRTGDIFLDIGANTGYFSLLASKQGAKVFSFEPSSEAFDRLQQNISLNDSGTITAFNTAVGENNEDRELFLSGSDNIGMSSFKKPENYSGKTEKVNVIKIDDWCKSSGLSSIHVVKIDVEGSELAVLKGMRKILETHQPILLIEINPTTLSSFGLSPSDIYSYLDQLNFEAFSISKKGDFTKVSREKTEGTFNALFIQTDKKEFFRGGFNNN